MSKILGHALKLRCSGTNPLPQSGKASQIWAKPTRPQNYCILGLVVWHIFLTNVKQGTNLPFAWMCLTIWRCNAAHTSRVTSKFSSVETMHTTQSSSKCCTIWKKQRLFLNVRTNGKDRPGSINHSSQNVAKSNYIKKCFFPKATAKGSFEKELSWNTG